MDQSQAVEMRQLHMRIGGQRASISIETHSLPNRTMGELQ